MYNVEFDFQLKTCKGKALSLRVSVSNHQASGNGIKIAHEWMSGTKHKQNKTQISFHSWGIAKEWFNHSDHSQLNLEPWGESCKLGCAAS